MVEVEIRLLYIIVIKCAFACKPILHIWKIQSVTLTLLPCNLYYARILHIYFSPWCIGKISPFWGNRRRRTYCEYRELLVIPLVIQFVPLMILTALCDIGIEMWTIRPHQFYKMCQKFTTKVWLACLRSVCRQMYPSYPHVNFVSSRVCSLYVYFILYF